MDQVKTRCIRDQETNDFQWDLEDGRLQCIEPVGLVIGGIKETYDYTNNVEILAPGFQCLRTDYPVYPHKIIGLAGGYTRGLNIVCGGAKMEYVECKKHSEGSQDCDRNTECVITSGGARWCTGPKLRECYVYDPFIGNVRPYICFKSQMYLKLNFSGLETRHQFEVQKSLRSFHNTSQWPTMDKWRCKLNQSSEYNRNTFSQKWEMDGQKRP